MIMKFKTNAKCQGCVNAILKALEPVAPADRWSFDLDSPDRTLTYLAGDDSEATADTVIRLIEGAGFKAARIG